MNHCLADRPAGNQVQTSDGQAIRRPIFLEEVGAAFWVEHA
jgi:hypothetical protein